MSKEKWKLTSFQLFALLTNVMTGTGVFTITRTVGTVAGRGAPVAILLSGLVVLVMISFMYLLVSRFPGKPYPILVQSAVGRWPGRIYLLLNVVVQIIFSAVIAKNYWYVVNSYQLFGTPMLVFTSMMVLLGWQMARRGIVVLARVSEIVLLITLPLLVLLFIPVPVIRVRYALPIFDRGFTAVIKAMPQSIFAFLGFDILLFALPLVKKQRSVLAGGLAVGLTSLSYAIVTLLIIMGLSMERANVTVYPLAAYLGRIQLPIVERLDTIFMILWLFQVIMSVGVPIYIAASSLYGAIPRLGRHFSTDICASLILIAAAWPLTRPLLFELTEPFNYVAILFTGGVPVLIWVIAILRKKGGKQDEAKKTA